MALVRLHQPTRTISARTKRRRRILLRNQVTLPQSHPCHMAIVRHLHLLLYPIHPIIVILAPPLVTPPILPLLTRGSRAIHLPRSIQWMPALNAHHPHLVCLSPHMLLVDHHPRWFPWAARHQADRQAPTVHHENPYLNMTHPNLGVIQVQIMSTCLHLMWSRVRLPISITSRASGKCII